MGNSFRLFLCGIFLVANATAAESSFKSDLLETLQMYSKQNNIGLNKPTDNFMGFSISSFPTENHVTVFHADSPVDVIINQYNCTSSGCEQKARDPRCFYYTPGGTHAAMSLYDLAFEQLQNPRAWAVEEFKFWQLGAAVYGRISSLTAHENELYSCSMADAKLVCQSVAEIPDEP